MRKRIEGSKIGFGTVNADALANMLMMRWSDNEDRMFLVYEVTTPDTDQIRLFVVSDAWKGFSKPERDAIVYSAVANAEDQRMEHPNAYPEIPALLQVSWFEGLIPDEAKLLGLPDSA